MKGYDARRMVAETFLELAKQYAVVVSPDPLVNVLALVNDVLSLAEETRDPSQMHRERMRNWNGSSRNGQVANGG